MATWRCGTTGVMGGGAGGVGGRPHASTDRCKSAWDGWGTDRRGCAETVRGEDRVGNEHMLKRAERIGQLTMVTSSEICLHLWGSNHHRRILKLASLMRLSNSHICIVISSEMGIDNHASNEFVVLDHTSVMGITSEIPLVEIFLRWDLSSGTWIDEMALSDQCYSRACLHEQHYQRCFWFTHVSNLTSATCFVLVSLL